MPPQQKEKEFRNGPLMHASKLATVSMAALAILVVFRQVVSVAHYSCTVVDQETMAR